MTSNNIRNFNLALVAGTLFLSTGCQAYLPQTGQRLTLESQSLATNNAPLKASQFSKQGSIPGEILIRFKPGVQRGAVQNTLQAFQLQTLKQVGPAQWGLHLVKAPSAQMSAQALQALNQNPSVLYAEPNGIMGISPNEESAPPRLMRNDAFPNDEMFNDQYAHQRTESLKGWEIQKGKPDLVVAVVDTGVDLNHPDLKDNMLPKGYDFVDDDEVAMDEQGHGTHCAGISAGVAHNKIGIAGYAPGAKIMPVRVLDRRGSGTWADVASGIAWAADNGAHVINLSLGGSSDSKVVGDAVKHALDKDVVVVAAMGNDGNNTKSYPAAYPGVVAVGATNSQDRIAGFSQYGEWTSVSAPGVSILSTMMQSRRPYSKLSGTSMASPAVAGLAALVRSQFPDLSQAEVKAHIEHTAEDLGDAGYDIHYGHGRINVFKALSTPPARRRR